MGPVAVVVAIGIGIAGAIAAKVTSDMVEDLKRQINKIVDEHKDEVDKLKAFQDLLYKLDMQKVYDVMKDVSEGVSGSFKTFLIDQQERMKYIQEIRIKQLSKDPLAGIFQELMKVLNIIGTELMVIQIATATNPATIVVSGIMLVLSGILGIFTTIGNIMAINDLKAKKEDLLNYFKPGGQFDQAQLKLKDSAIQVTKNLYMLVLNGKNLLKTLTMRIVLLQLDGSTNSDYGTCLRALQTDYFDAGFEKLVLDTYMKLVQIDGDKNLTVGAQISRMFTVLQHMMDVQNIPKKLQQFTETLSHFTKGSSVAVKIDAEYKYLHALNDSRLTFAKKFEMRNGKKGEDLTHYDQRLLKSMSQDINLPQGITEDKKKLQIAQMTSFFTNKFFGDPNNDSGKMLYGYNLQELQKKTQLLEYVDAFSMSNGFMLPEPLSGEDKVEWTVKKNKLLEEFMKSYKGQDKPFIQFVYMRMQNQTKTIIEGKKITVLKLIYGIELKIRGNAEQYEMTIEDLNRAITHQDIINARLQSYVTIDKVLDFVTDPIVLKGLDYVIDGQLNGTLDILQKARQFIAFLPEKWKHFKIGDRTVEEQAKDFRGLSINLKELKYEDTGIILKNESIAIKTQKFASPDFNFVINQMLFYIMGSCMPWRVEALDVIKNGNNYEGTIEYSDSVYFGNFLGKVLNQMIIKGTQDLQNCAEKLRDKKRQLFLITITTFEDVICWYME